MAKNKRPKPQPSASWDQTGFRGRQLFVPPVALGPRKRWPRKTDLSQIVAGLMVANYLEAYLSGWDYRSLGAAYDPAQTPRLALRYNGSRISPRQGESTPASKADARALIGAALAKLPLDGEPRIAAHAPLSKKHPARKAKADAATVAGVFAPAIGALERNLPALLRLRFRDRKRLGGTYAWFVVSGFKWTVHEDELDLWLRLIDSAALGTNHAFFSRLGASNVHTVDAGNWKELRGAVYWVRARTLVGRYDRRWGWSYLDIAHTYGGELWTIDGVRLDGRLAEVVGSGFCLPVPVEGPDGSTNTISWERLDRLGQGVVERLPQLGGSYPFGVNRTWHGGIHLSATAGGPVRSVGPGRVIAVRAEAANPPTGSRNFVLVEHRAEGSLAADKRFYALFMHLAPITRALEVAPAEENAPSWWRRHFVPPAAEDAPPPSVAAGGDPTPLHLFAERLGGAPVDLGAFPLGKERGTLELGPGQPVELVSERFRLDISGARPADEGPQTTLTSGGRTWQLVRVPAAHREQKSNAATARENAGKLRVPLYFWNPAAKGGGKAIPALKGQYNLAEYLQGIRVRKDVADQVGAGYLPVRLPAPLDDDHPEAVGAVFKKSWIKRLGEDGLLELHFELNLLVYPVLGSDGTPRYHGTKAYLKPGQTGTRFQALDLRGRVPPELLPEGDAPVYSYEAPGFPRRKTILLRLIPCVKQSEYQRSKVALVQSLAEQRAGDLLIGVVRLKPYRPLVSRRSRGKRRTPPWTLHPAQGDDPPYVQLSPGATEPGLVWVDLSSRAQPQRRVLEVRDAALRIPIVRVSTGQELAWIRLGAGVAQAALADSLHTRQAWDAAREEILDRRRRAVQGGEVIPISAPVAAGDLLGRVGTFEPPASGKKPKRRAKRKAKGGALLHLEFFSAENLIDPGETTTQEEGPQPTARKEWYVLTDSDFGGDRDALVDASILQRLAQWLPEEFPQLPAEAVAGIAKVAGQAPRSPAELADLERAFAEFLGQGGEGIFRRLITRHRSEWEAPIRDEDLARFGVADPAQREALRAAITPLQWWPELRQAVVSYNQHAQRDARVPLPPGPLYYHYHPAQFLAWLSTRLHFPELSQKSEDFEVTRIERLGAANGDGAEAPPLAEGLRARGMEYLSVLPGPTPSDVQVTVKVGQGSLVRRRSLVCGDTELVRLEEPRVVLEHDPGTHGMPLEPWSVTGVDYAGRPAGEQPATGYWKHAHGDARSFLLPDGGRRKQLDCGRVVFRCKVLYNEVPPTHLELDLFHGASHLYALEVALPSELATLGDGPQASVRTLTFHGLEPAQAATVLSFPVFLSSKTADEVRVGSHSVNLQVKAQGELEAGGLRVTSRGGDSEGRSAELPLGGSRDVIRAGDAGRDVALLQYYLSQIVHAAGYDIDGHYNPRMRALVWRYLEHPRVARWHRWRGSQPPKPGKEPPFPEIDRSAVAEVLANYTWRLVRLWRFELDASYQLATPTAEAPAPDPDDAPPPLEAEPVDAPGYAGSSSFLPPGPWDLALGQPQGEESAFWVRFELGRAPEDVPLGGGTSAQGTFEARLVDAPGLRLLAAQDWAKLTQPAAKHRAELEEALRELLVPQPDPNAPVGTPPPTSTLTFPEKVVKALELRERFATKAQRLLTKRRQPNRANRIRHEVADVRQGFAIELWVVPDGEEPGGENPRLELSFPPLWQEPRIVALTPARAAIEPAAQAFTGTRPHPARDVARIERFLSAIHVDAQGPPLYNVRSFKGVYRADVAAAIVGFLEALSPDHQGQLPPAAPGSVTLNIPGLQGTQPSVRFQALAGSDAGGGQPLLAPVIDAWLRDALALAAALPLSYVPVVAPTLFFVKLPAKARRAALDRRLQAGTSKSERADIEYLQARYQAFEEKGWEDVYFPVTGRDLDSNFGYPYRMQWLDSAFEDPNVGAGPIVLEISEGTLPAAPPTPPDAPVERKLIDQAKAVAVTSYTSPFDGKQLTVEGYTIGVMSAATRKMLRIESGFEQDLLYKHLPDKTKPAGALSEPSPIPTLDWRRYCRSPHRGEYPAFYSKNGYRGYLSVYALDPATNTMVRFCETLRWTSERKWKTLEDGTAKPKKKGKRHSNEFLYYGIKTQTGHVKWKQAAEKLGGDLLHTIFQSDSAWRAAYATGTLEGTFNTVQTWDNGILSFSSMQFTMHASGLEDLLPYWRDRQNHTFRRWLVSNGFDVTGEGGNARLVFRPADERTIGFPATDLAGRTADNTFVRKPGASSIGAPAVGGRPYECTKKWHHRLYGKDLRLAWLLWKAGQDPSVLRVICEFLAKRFWEEMCDLPGIDYPMYYYVTSELGMAFLHEYHANRPRYVLGSFRDALYWVLVAPPTGIWDELPERVYEPLDSTKTGVPKVSATWAARRAKLQQGEGFGEDFDPLDSDFHLALLKAFKVSKYNYGMSGDKDRSITLASKIPWTKDKPDGGTEPFWLSHEAGSFLAPGDVPVTRPLGQLKRDPARWSTFVKESIAWCTRGVKYGGPGRAPKPKPAANPS